MSDAIIYLTTEGDGGRLHAGSGIKEAVAAQQKLVDLYYLFVDSILREDTPDYSSALEFIKKFKVEFNKFKAYECVQMHDRDSVDVLPALKGEDSLGAILKEHSTGLVPAAGMLMHTHFTG